MDTNKPNQVRGYFRRKYMELFFLIFSVAFPLFLNALNFVFSPFISPYFANIENQPPDIQLYKRRLGVLLAIGGFILLNSAISWIIIRIGLKTKKHQSYPYPGMFNLFDTQRLDGETAIKKGNQIIRAGVIYILASIGCILWAEYIFTISRLFL